MSLVVMAYVQLSLGRAGLLLTLERLLRFVLIDVYYQP